MKSLLQLSKIDSRIICSILICLCALQANSLRAASVSVAVTNYSGTALCLYDVTADQWVSTNFCANANAPATPSVEDFSLDETHKYNVLSIAASPASGGHEFHFNSGRMYADWFMMKNLPYYSISTSRWMVVRGVSVAFRLITPATGQPDYEDIRVNASCEGRAEVGRPAFVAHLIPADGNFDGLYTNIILGTSGSSPGTLKLGTGMDIVDWTGAGHSFVSTGPRSIRITTDTDEVLDLIVGPTFFEAEDMTHGAQWSATNTSYYSGFISGSGMLRGDGPNGPGQGVASNSVVIDEAGLYRVWVRHFSGSGGSVTIEVEQGGSTAATGTLDSATTAWSWGYADAELVAGSADIVLTKVGGIPTLDCVLVTRDPAYVPDAVDFVSPLYLKVAIDATQTNPCAILIWGIYNAGLLGGNGYRVGGNHTGYTSTYVPPYFLYGGETSPWVNIGPGLQLGPSEVFLDAIQVYTATVLQGLAASDYRVFLSSTPSETGIFREYARAGTGCGKQFFVDPRDHETATSDLDCAGEAYQAMLPFIQNPSPGRRPTKFPTMVTCRAFSSFYGPDIVSNEIAIITGMGFNSKWSYDPPYAAAGFERFAWGAGYFSPAYFTNSCHAAPNVPKITNLVNKSIQALIDTGRASDALYSLQADEPYTLIEDFLDCQYCDAGFRDYLSGQGFAPSEFGKSAWSEVHFTTNKVSEAKLFYHSMLYRCRTRTDAFKLGTDVITNMVPDLKVMANFGEWSTFYGNMLKSGCDWFEILGPKAGLTYGWTEDWLNLSITMQLTGYRADLLRAACRPCNRRFGMYSMFIHDRPPWDACAKAICKVGHGVDNVYQYCYGPYYSPTADAESYHYEVYPALQEANYLIGAVEDLLVGATVPTSRVALLFSHTTDAWTMTMIEGDTGNTAHSSVFGKDRMGIYLALRHLGYPVEFVTEAEVIGGEIDDYDVLIVAASHLHADALIPLVSWVQDGGTLMMGSGSLDFDQYSNALGFDTLVDIERGAFNFRRGPETELHNLPQKLDLKPVTFNGSAMESICGYQTVAYMGSGATVLATFTGDQSPAAFTKSVGYGELVFYGFFPGLAYMKGASESKQARDTQPGYEEVTYGSTDYPLVYRTFFSELMDLVGCPPALPTSHYLVEVNRLEHTNGTVLAVVNWAGEDLEDVQISFAREARAGIPWSVINPIKHRAEQDGIITLTLDLVGAADMIVLPQAANRGFQGQYFSGTNSPVLVLTRNDDAIGFDWGQDAPDPMVDGDGFAVRWTGLLTPLYSETYTFHITADDGARLWVNGNLLIDDWTPGPVRTHSATIDLTGGQAVLIQLEYGDWSGGASVMLEWESPTQVRGLVPSGAVTPTAGVLCSDNFERYARGPLPPANGWVSSSAAVAVSNAVGLGWAGGNPFPSHTNALWLPGEEQAANTPVSDGSTRVWVDFYTRPMLSHRPLDEIPADTNRAIMVFFDAAGRAVVRDGPAPGAWRVLTNNAAGAAAPQVSGSDLVRVSVFANFSNKSFAVFLEDTLLAEDVRFAADRSGYTGLAFKNRAHVDNVLVNADTYPDGMIPGANPALIGDLDGDGWPDAWEIQMYGTIGNDPPTANAQIAITDFRVSGTTIWMVAHANLTDTDLHPQPWYSATLGGTSAQWWPVVDAPYIRSGGVYTQWFSLTTNRHGFYRIVATNQP